ncbi:protein WVD2-like 7 isoform X2 [Brassica napus]|uniref:protein WVD2-like 7 isoform X2 n=1 Tax=Brassica napus TaxID=3708 RepID=UPI0020786270|nr:protein WVD2-like 7 isoform X2 [Brassica napus]
MGDSVCLARSFSQPADTSSHEVVPRGVLTESVSFGRFASETLQWAKWSAFTQNRYLEEVERFTKPGSVAEKKAFFEAHFKNRASGNTTKTKKTQEGTVLKTVCGAQKENLVDSEVRHGDVVCSSVKTSYETVCGVLKENLPLVDEVRHVAPSISVTDATADVQIGEVKDTIAENNDSMAVDEDEELDKENSASLSKERRPRSSMPVPEDEDLDKNSTSLSKERGPSSSASKTYGRSSNPELDLPLKKPRKETLSTKRNQRRSPPQPFHMSIDCAPTDNAGKKMHQNGSRSSTKVKDALKADKKERSGPSSVHMPLNSATSTRQTTKTAPKRLARRSTTQETSSSNAGTSSKPKGTEPAVASKGRKRPLSRGAKEDSDVPKCSTTASAFGLPKLPPPPPNSRPLDEKRKNITGGSSVSSRIPNNVQRQPSASCDNVPTHSRTRAKSFTVSTPFNFRSDERAEKRKEFFKKIEEKKKKEDAVKEQSSCGFKEHQEFKNPQVGGVQAPMISLTSPRVRRNQTPGRENIQKSRESPHKVASVKTTTTRNPSMEKYKRCKIHPSLTKKKTQEDSSPHVL